MLPNVKNDPLLRCTAKSRRSGWQQCKNPKAFGSRTVCRYHGAQRTKRHGKLNPNYKSGKYTKKALERSKKLGQTLRALEQLVEISNAQYAQFKLHEKQRTSAEIGREIKRRSTSWWRYTGFPPIAINRLRSSPDTSNKPRLGGSNLTSPGENVAYKAT